MCGRADLIRALGTGQPGAIERMAVLLGYHPTEMPAGLMLVGEPAADPILHQLPVRHDSDQAAEAMVPFWRPVHYQAVEREIPPPSPDIIPQKPVTGLLDPAQPPPTARPLAPWRDIEPRLRRAAAVPRQARGLDTVRIVRDLARGRLLDRLPHRFRRGWGAAVQVVFDRSENLVPFWADQDLVFSRLLRLLGPDSIEVALIHEALDAPQVLHPRQSEGGYRSPPPSGIVLVLGDLGCLQGGRAMDRWIALGRRLAAANCRAVALFPVPLGRCPRALQRWWTLVPWERPSGAASVDPAERQRRADRLLRLLAPAVSIEPGLLREARRLLDSSEADSGTEADVWNHAAIASTSLAAASPAPHATGEFKAEFEAELASNESGPEQHVLGLIRQWRNNLPAELWYEEVMQLGPNANRLISKADLVQARGFFDAFADHLSQVPQEDVSATARRAWFRRVCSREDHHLWRDRAVGDKLRRLGCQLHRHDAGTSRPRWYDPALVPPDDPAMTERMVELRQLGGALHLDIAVSENASSSGSPLVRLRTINGEISVAEADPFWKSGIPPDWASAWGRDQYGAWVEFTVGDIIQRMRWCPPGTFRMGSPGGDADAGKDEKPQHEVTLTQGFWLCDTSCTQELWQAVMGDNPSHFTSSPRLPVERVGWDGVLAFLSRLNGRVPGLNLALPTEAQWEYACRANDATAPDLDAVAWYGDNSEGKTHPVASKAANAWGLHDMLGNVWEWCADGMRDYGPDAIADPVGPKDNGASRVVRGGAWRHAARAQRAAYRIRSRSDASPHYLGFRCARVQKNQSGQGWAEPAELQVTQGARSVETGLLRLDHGAQAARCPLPQTGFRVLTDCERLTFDRIIKPAWASAIGRDRFGLWTEIRVSDVAQRMRWISPGRFWMGSPPDEDGRWDDEGPQHEVTLTKGFWLFDTPCTQELWQAVMGNNPSHFTSSPRLPVEQVSWDDVQTFLSCLNERLPGLNLSLPTEAQWEYACRAGSARAPDLDLVAWHDANSGEETHPVAGKVANAWGVYDMLGNVWEWCDDGGREYCSEQVSDPVGPLKATDSRLTRGGSWDYIARFARAATRDRSKSGDRLSNLGFRCARVQK